MSDVDIDPAEVGRSKASPSRYAVADSISAMPRLAWTAAVVLTALFVVACSGDDGSYDSPLLNEDIPVADIADLPDIEETRTQMLELVEQARAEVMQALPHTGPWEWRGDEAGAPCTQESTGHRGTARYLRRLVLESDLTDDEWSAVLPIVRGIAAENGLTNSSSPQGASGSRDVRFTSKDGRELIFISRVTTLFGGTIACRRYGSARG